MPFNENGDSEGIPFSVKARAFLSSTSFGTIDQLRVEMETMYKGVHIILNTEDNKKIDCMFIPGYAQNPDHEGREEFEMPTIIY